MAPYDRAIQVSVIKHDEGRVAAQLHRDLLHGRGGLRHQELADLGGTRERDLLDGWVGGQFRSDLAR